MSFPRAGATRTLAILCASAAAGLLALAQVSAPASLPETKPRARIAFAHALPELNGNRLQASIVEVHYGPGESSSPHSHPCAVISYVLEGTIRTQVKGEAQAIYKPGESFYEAPGGVHLVSANASSTEPATFLAYFVCDHDTPLSVDVPEIKKPGGK